MKFNIIGVLFGISVVERTSVSLKNKGSVMPNNRKRISTRSSLHLLPVQKIATNFEARPRMVFFWEQIKMNYF
jgi:hypothetical protein